MLAERRDFTVATYSSARGTGARLIVSTFTGNGCGAGAFASVVSPPVRTKGAARAAGAGAASLVNFRLARSLRLNTYLIKDARCSERDSKPELSVLRRWSVRIIFVRRCAI